jgi:hypothetical protein
LLTAYKITLPEEEAMDKKGEEYLKKPNMVNKAQLPHDCKP